MAGDADRQSAKQDSKVDNRGAQYTNVRDVYNAPVTHQTIVKDDSVTYEVDREDVRGLERLSMWLMKVVGERNVKITAVVTIVFGGGGIVAVTNPSVNLPGLVVTPLTYAAFLAILVGAVFVAALQYKANSRCVKCNRFYAMQEAGEPIVKEVPRRGGTQVSTTRRYECRYCGHSAKKTENEFVEDEPSEN